MASWPSSLFCEHSSEECVGVGGSEPALSYGCQVVTGGWPPGAQPQFGDRKPLPSSLQATWTACRAQDGCLNLHELLGSLGWCVDVLGSEYCRWNHRC